MRHLRIPPVQARRLADKHLVLRLEEFNLANELIAAAASQEEQEGLEEAFHDDILLQLK